MVDAVNNLTINNAKYYKSSTVTATDAQDNLTRNQETVTHTSNENETFIHTSNRNFGQKLLSNRTIPIMPPAMNPGIYQGIALIILALQTLLVHAMKEFVADTASGGARVNRTPRKLSRTGLTESP